MSSLLSRAKVFAFWIVGFAFMAGPEAHAQNSSHILATPSAELNVAAWQRSAKPIIDGDLSEWPELTDALKTSKNSISPFSAYFRADHTGLFVAAVLAPLRSTERLEFAVALETSIGLPAVGSPGVGVEIVKQCQPQPKTGKTQLEEMQAGCPAFLAVNTAHQDALLHRFRREFILSDAGFLQTNPKVLAWPGTDSERKTGFLPEPGVSNFAQQSRAGKLRLEWHIPWESLPWTNQRLLEKLYLRIERCVGKKCAALLPNNSRASYDALTLRLPIPKFYQVSNCDLPLAAQYRDLWYPGYFQPHAAATIDVVFAIANPYGEYFRGPDLGHRVPEVAVYRYSETKLGPDEYVCGPIPFYRNRKLAGKTLFALHPETAKASSTAYRGPVQYAFLPQPLKIAVLTPRLALVLEPSTDLFSGSLEGGGAAEPQLTSKVWLLDRKLGTWLLLFEASQSIIVSSFFPDYLNQNIKTQGSIVLAEVTHSPDLRTINILFGTNIETGLAEHEVVLCLNLKARAYQLCQQ